MPRFHCPAPLVAGAVIALPPGAARHVQVLRLQPGGEITLFNGEGGEWRAVVERMGRSDVDVLVVAHDAVDREPQREVHLVVGMPANERMDWLVEKATELGAASIQPVVAQRSVLKLQGERGERKLAHWQGIAVAACEQSGRNRVPAVLTALPLAQWLAQRAWAGQGLLLSPAPQARPLREAAAGGGPLTLLSGPEGGLAAAEEQAAQAAGFLPVSLGPRILRAETAPLAALAGLLVG
jgi:16S rRNA (uracil1498-N3)-methyltransferase